MTNPEPKLALVIKQLKRAEEVLCFVRQQRRPPDPYSHNMDERRLANWTKNITQAIISSNRAALRAYEETVHFLIDHESELGCVLDGVDLAGFFR